jgi:hypothetical protein
MHGVGLRGKDGPDIDCAVGECRACACALALTSPGLEHLYVHHASQPCVAERKIYLPLYGHASGCGLTSAILLATCPQLLDAGADFMLADEKGVTPLDAARSGGHEACVQLLEVRGPLGWWRLIVWPWMS